MLVANLVGSASPRGHSISNHSSGLLVRVVGGAARLTVVVDRALGLVALWCCRLALVGVGLGWNAIDG